MKDFKYIVNDGSDDAGVAVMLLHGSIGLEIDEQGILSGIDGSIFAAEMLWLENFVQKIEIRINSYGGSVIDGYSIISAILHCKVPVTTIIDGMAFSIAGLISIVGSNRSIMDNGLIMVHNPSGGSKKILSDIKDSLIVLFEGNTNMKNISELMDNETVFNAKEALSAGLVDQIIKSKRKIDIKTNDIKEIYNIYNKAINYKPKTMNKIINKLGLEDSATEDSVIDKISVLQEQLVSLTDAFNSEKTAKEELLNKLSAIEVAETAKKELEITEMVNSFVNSKVIDATEVNSMISFAKVDFSKTKNMLERLSVKDANKAVSLIEKIKIGNTYNTDKGWDYSRYEKEDPKSLQDMYINNKEAYDKLYNEFLNKNKIK